jgi:YHS domain-containing protein
MVEMTKPGEAELLPCAVCQKKVAKSVALTSEDQDYRLYFCSPDCYESWAEDRMAVTMQEAGGG